MLGTVVYHKRHDVQRVGPLLSTHKLSPRGNAYSGFPHLVVTDPSMWHFPLQKRLCGQTKCSRTVSCVTSGSNKAVVNSVHKFKEKPQTSKIQWHFTRVTDVLRVELTDLRSIHATNWPEMERRKQIKMSLQTMWTLVRRVSGAFSLFRFFSVSICFKIQNLLKRTH